MAWPSCSARAPKPCCSSCTSAHGSFDPLALPLAMQGTLQHFVLRNSLAACSAVPPESLIKDAPCPQECMWVSDLGMLGLASTPAVSRL